MSNFKYIFDENDRLISDSIRFWLCLIPNCLSILCSLFALYQLLSDQTFRQALQNHVFILLLFIGSIYQWKIISSMIFYYYFVNI